MMEWIVTSSVLILIMAGLRLALKGKISLRLQYALWALVLIRLLCPVNFLSSPVSVLNVTKEAVSQPEIRNVIENVQEPIHFESKGYEIHEETGESIPVTNTYFVAPSNDINNPYSTEDILMGIWVTGAVLTFGIMLTCNFHFRRKIRQGRKALEVSQTSLPVFVSDKLETPCMFGLFRPAIYLTTESVEDEERLRHILEHELTHYYHCDYITAPLRCLALALHWYNPLVWWAAKASRLDGELACDEGTIARLGESERSSYGKTLIQMTCNHRHLTDVMLTATTMSGSKYSIRERITRIAQKPHMAAATVAVVLLTALIAVGCTFTGAADGMSESLKQEIREHGKEYLTEVNFSLVQEEGQEPYGLLFLPEYMPKEGLTLELKSIKEDGTEEILHTQDTIKLGEKYIFEDLDNYGELKLTMYYVVDGKAIDKIQSYVNLKEMQDSQKDFQMVNSVKKLMSDYAGDYFSEKVEKHNNQLFLPEEEKYNGVSYSEPNQIVTPMASEQNLYLHKIEARYPRADGEKVEDQVYILMHWNGENWEYVTLAPQETIEAYNTQEMLNKYSGTMYDAAAIELYIKHREDAVDLEEAVQVKLIHSQGDAAGLPGYLVDIVTQVVEETMAEDYPDRSVDVYMTGASSVKLGESADSLYLYRIEFYPSLSDNSQGINYEKYLVVFKDPDTKERSLIRVYDCKDIDSPETGEGDRITEAARSIWEEMLQEIKTQEEWEAEALEQRSKLEVLGDHQVPMTVSLNYGQELDGRNTSNAFQQARSILSGTYVPVEEPAIPDKNNVVRFTIAEFSLSITFYESGCAAISDEEGTWYYETNQYSNARIWYDEAELVAVGASYYTQGHSVIADQGQTPGQAALEYCQYFEGLRTQLSDGSSFKYTFVSCFVKIEEEQTENMRSEGRIDENTWCFNLTTIFVPENEMARTMAYAGNTREYVGDNPAVPEGALQYSRTGYIAQSPDGWVGQLIGTGW